MNQKNIIFAISLILVLSFFTFIGIIKLKNKSTNEIPETSQEKNSISAMPAQEKIAQANDNELLNTKDWQTYSSDVYGFSFKYPSDYISIDSSGSNYDQSVVNIFSPGAQKNMKEEKPYSESLSVYYYNSVADESENKANNLNATNINEMIQKNSMIRKNESIKVDNEDAVSVFWGGNSAYYAILIMHKNHLYKLWFGDTIELSPTQKTILSTFKFTK